MTIHPPVWKKCGASDKSWYFTGPFDSIYECWQEMGTDAWWTNGRDCTSYSASEQEAKAKAEAAYYQEMAKFVDPGIMVYVLLRYVDEGTMVDGAFSTLELAKANATGRGNPGTYNILEIDVDDMSGPLWPSHAVDE